MYHKHQSEIKVSINVITGQKYKSASGTPAWLHAYKFISRRLTRVGYKGTVNVRDGASVYSFSSLILYKSKRNPTAS